MRIVKRMKDILLDKEPRNIERKYYGEKQYLYKIDKHEITFYS